MRYPYLDQILLCIPKLFHALLALYREKFYNTGTLLQVQNLIPSTEKTLRINIFHVALHLFVKRSQMTSKRGKNTKWHTTRKACGPMPYLGPTGGHKDCMMMITRWSSVSFMFLSRKVLSPLYSIY